MVINAIILIPLKWNQTSEERFLTLIRLDFLKVVFPDKRQVKLTPPHPTPPFIFQEEPI